MSISEIRKIKKFLKTRVLMDQTDLIDEIYFVTDYNYTDGGYLRFGENKEQFNYNYDSVGYNGRWYLIANNKDFIYKLKEKGERVIISELGNWWQFKQIPSADIHNYKIIKEIYRESKTKR